MDILYTLALCNGKINFDYFYKYIESDSMCLYELYKRRFISCENSNEISIIHESLFIYLYSNLMSKKKILKELASVLIHKPNIDLELNDFHLGRLCMFSNDYNRAIAYFDPIISWLKLADNISNLNIDMKYYEYLNDIFEVLRTKKAMLALAKKHFY